MRFVHRGHADLGAVRPLLDEPLARTARFHAETDGRVGLDDGDGLHVPPQSPGQMLDPGADVGLLGWREDDLGLGGVGFSLGLFDRFDAEGLVDVALQAGDPEHVAVVQMLELPLHPHGELFGPVSVTGVDGPKNEVQGRRAQVDQFLVAEDALLGHHYHPLSVAAREVGRANTPRLLDAQSLRRHRETGP